MSRPTRTLRVAVALTGAALVSIPAMVPAVPAAASSVGHGTVCAHFSGPFPSGPFVVSGCSHRAREGGTGTLDNRTGVISWATGKTTTISAVLTAVSQDESERHGCPGTSAFELSEHGTVTADTTGVNAVGGPVRVELCGRENGVLQNEQGSRFALR